MAALLLALLVVTLPMAFGDATFLNVLIGVRAADFDNSELFYVMLLLHILLLRFFAQHLQVVVVVLLLRSLPLLSPPELLLLVLLRSFAVGGLTNVLIFLLHILGLMQSVLSIFHKMVRLAGCGFTTTAWAAAARADSNALNAASEHNPRPPLRLASQPCVRASRPRPHSLLDETFGLLDGVRAHWVRVTRGMSSRRAHAR